MISEDRVIVVGGGIAGLIAARELALAGRIVTVLDKGRRPGGRMSTRRTPPAVFDHGAQFFTVRSPEFAAIVADWVAQGVAEPWCQGFGPGADGHTRYRGATGMSDIPARLARGLDVRASMHVTAVRRLEDRWAVETRESGCFEAESLVLTPPVPQSLALLDAGGVALEPGRRAALELIRYDPCFALLLMLDAPGNVLTPGGEQVRGEVITWVGDNEQKGISSVPALTIHASPAWSAKHFDDPESAVAASLTLAAAPWIGDARVVGAQLMRWRYAIPVAQHPSRAELDLAGPPLVLAGDAFGEPRVEGAVLSGLAAAESLLSGRDRGFRQD